MGIIKTMQTRMGLMYVHMNLHRGPLNTRALRSHMPRLCAPPKTQSYHKMENVVQVVELLPLPAKLPTQIRRRSLSSSEEIRYFKGDIGSVTSPYVLPSIIWRHSCRCSLKWSMSLYLLDRACTAFCSKYYVLICHFFFPNQCTEPWIKFEYIHIINLIFHNYLDYHFNLDKNI